MHYTRSARGPETIGFKSGVNIQGRQPTSCIGKPQNARQRTTRALATEVLSIILVFAFGSFQTNARLYDATRRKCRQTCRWFSNVIDTTPRAWSCIYISLDTPPVYIIQLFRKARALPRTVHFDFVDRVYIRNRTWTTINVATVVNVSFVTLQGYAEKCEGLTVGGHTETFQKQIMAYTAAFRSSTLRYLSLKLSAYAPSPFLDDPIPDFGLPDTTNMPAVSELSLAGAMPQWPEGQPYRNLRALTLIEMRGRATFTWGEANTLFGLLQRLEHLGMHDVECTDFPISKEMLPVLPALKELDVTSTSGSSSRLIGTLSTPAVWRLRINASMDADVFHLLISNMDALKSATHLILSTSARKTSTIRSLLCKAPNLMTLDIRNSPDRLFHLLAEAISEALPIDFGQGQICSRLDRIRASTGIGMADLRTVLIHRDKTFFKNGVVVEIPPVFFQGMLTTIYFESDGRIEARGMQELERSTRLAMERIGRAPCSRFSLSERLFHHERIKDPRQIRFFPRGALPRTKEKGNIRRNATEALFAEDIKSACASMQ
ncbi:hypothetical protein C8R46DRAFT_1032726 [Mycena filopes]|nr:hypothetical protein C8R46DRAFT_1032726 [Mycena filopes]